MFNVSQLVAIIPTTIAITSFIVAAVAVAGGATFTSIHIHSKRHSTKKDKEKQKTKVPEKDNKKVNQKTKVSEKENNNKKVQTKQVGKKQTQTQTATTNKAKIQKPVVDKSNLIGEEKVVVEDLNANSKYNWVYSINLKSEKVPENNITLSWKTNDKKSIIDALLQDSRFAAYNIINNNDLSSVDIDAKYIDENGTAQNYNNDYAIDGDILSVKQFKKDVNNLLEKMSITKTATVKEEIDPVL